MIPSFHPVRERLDSDAFALATAGLTADQLDLACAGSTPTLNPNSGLAMKSIDDLLASSKLVRYPDNSGLSYPDLLSAELHNPSLSPFTANGGALWINGVAPPKVAVVGGGLSGLLCAFQLSKLGAAVDLFDASPAPNGNATSPQGAGRIFPVNVNPSDPNTRGELGAMRFPDTSYMFWHYMKLMVPTATGFTEFPNPGKVPTLLSGEQQLSALWKNGGFDINAGSDNGFNLNSLQTRHLNAFLNISRAGYTLNQVSTWMTDGTAASDSGTANNVRAFWQALQTDYYRTSYLQFLQNSGFSAAEIDILGYLGVGTGGFKPLFATCVLDIMRLFIWSYAGEYAVPDLYKLPLGLMNAASFPMGTYGGGFYYNTCVNYVLYSRTWGKYVLNFKSTSDGVGREYASGPYHYVVCAMTHKALSNMLATAPASAPSWILPYAPDPVFPFGAASMPTARSAFYADVKNQQGLPSVKIFQTMAGPSVSQAQKPVEGDFSSVTPNNGAPYGRNVRVVFGKSGTTSNGAPLGVTYMLPPPGQEFPASAKVVGLQYSWGPDSVALRSGLLASNSAVNASLNATGMYFGAGNSSLWYSINTAIVLALDDRERLTANTWKISTPEVVNGVNLDRYFAPYRLYNPPADEGSYAIVDWDRVPYVNMGFKLDAPGRGNPSIYRFVHQALKLADSTLLPAGSWDNGVVSDPSVKGVYFCGDSFSNYGGWAEGAFQSAMNVVASIAYGSANAWGVLQNLSIGAKALIETAPPAFDQTIYPGGPTYS